jgi:hypothetical protein
MSYELEEPIHVRFEIKNIGHTNVFLSPALVHITFFLKHEDEHKEVPLGSRILGTRLIRKEDILRLKSGSTYSFERSIMRQLYFNLPNRIGKFQLYAVYYNGLEHLDNVQVWTGELRSNLLEFEIR